LLSVGETLDLLQVAAIALHRYDGDMWPRICSDLEPRPLGVGGQLKESELTMPTNENLKRLASAFTVRDIMVGSGDLVCAADESGAVSASESNPDFNVIPIKNGNGFSSYYSCDSHQLCPIEVPDLIGDGTGILDLVDILESREFVFVLGRKQIDGYIHFSDLNRPLVKLTFYVLLEGVERIALDSVKTRIANADFLEETLGKSRFAQIQKAYERAGDAGQSLINYLNIADALKLARGGGKLEIEDSVIHAVRHVRNGAAHVSENLVSHYSDVKKLAQVKSQCLRVLRGS
jgi:hypothetical protein